MAVFNNIIIHGAGNNIYDTILSLKNFEDIKAEWYDGIFYVDSLKGLMLRRVLNETEDPSPFFEAIQKICIGHFLKACLAPSKPENTRRYTSFRESTLWDNFPHFMVPLGPYSRQICSERLIKEGRNELFRELCGKENETFKDIIDRTANSLKREDSSIVGELEADKFLNLSEETILSIKKLRDMQETGGDLDTVSSAVFYAYGLKKAAEKESENFKYGSDFKFVFINYHQGMKNLTESARPGNLYMADLPISTVPDLRGDLKYLKENGIKLIRYEDHHPYDNEHKQMLNELQSEGLIEYWAMSGPLQGKELAEKELKCGADMVFESMIEKFGFANDAMAFLRELTHAEDLALQRKEEGKILTDLIKGGVNKTELAQTLLECEEKEDIIKKLDEKGWIEHFKKEKELLKDLSEKFMENVRMLEIERPDFKSEDELSGPALDFGSDSPIPPSKRNTDQNTLKILIALAPHSKKGEPKLNVGRACEFYTKKLPDLDYIFFCYGASIIVARRLNQADTSLNLSVLMRKIGTESDGGHSGAAVASPENNEHYPKKLLGRVSASNFSRFCRYISDMMSRELEINVKSTKNISVRAENETENKKKNIKLLILVLSAVLIGLAVIIINKNYRFDKILEGNSDFFPYIEGKSPGNKNKIENLSK